MASYLKGRQEAFLRLAYGELAAMIAERGLEFYWPVLLAVWQLSQ
jgi:hypothetical protein